MSPAVSRALLAVQTCYFLHLSKKKKHTAGPTLQISPVVSTSETTRGAPTLNHHLPPQQSHQEAALAGVRQQVIVGGKKQVKEKLLLFLCVLQQGVCPHTSPCGAVTLSLFRSKMGQSTGPNGGSVLSNETSKAVPFCSYLFLATPKCPIRAVHLCMMNSLTPRLP